MDKKISDLKATHARSGKLEWIGIRPNRKEPLQTPDQVEFITGHGIKGDHRASKVGSKRQITLLQFEHLEVIAKLLGQPSIAAELLRRNLLVSGINLTAFRGETFSIGSAILQGTGYCHPCSRMEENLGSGGYNAVRHHGGITARVLEGGIVKLGAIVTLRDL